MNHTGPRLISHMAEEEQPSLDPRVALPNAVLTAAGKDPEEIQRLVDLKLGAWSQGNNVRFRAYPTRLPTSSRRWIGIAGADDPTGGHCLLMRGPDVIFDTAWLFPPRRDEPVSWHELEDVQLGITIE